ncbi:MAG: hypothetical protein ACI8RZ_001205 [Myxococcota bacterium]|jgi:hypothetical protein
MVPLLLTGCRLFSADNPLAYPEASLSTEWNLDAALGEVVVGEGITETVTLTNIGDIDLGVAQITLEQGTNFALTYDLDAAFCTLGGTGASEVEGGLLLHGGCALPIEVTFQPTDSGEVFDVIAVSTFTEDVSYPTWFADFRDPTERLMVSGTGLSGALVIEPLSVDFGQVAPGETVSAIISLDNTGDGPASVISPKLSCAEEFSLDTSLMSEALESGESTLLEVTFSPDNDGGSQCLVLLSTPQGGDRQVFLQGNRSSGVNAPPSLTLVSPDIGYIHDGIGDLEVQLSMSDPDQSADTLYCTIKSAWQTGTRIADCTPPDATGNITVSIPTDDLSEGVDTLEIRVVDDSDAIAIVTTTISWQGSPDGDDDGDLFGEPDDCDDSNPDTYPEAAEQWDGLDNNCDGTIDEGTEGVDDDGDSVTEAEGDCDDSDATVYPGAPEEADQQDNDCDGEVDEGTHAVDDDGDGFSPDLGDCDDGNAEVFPGAEELCDGFDNDCDYQVDFADDEGCTSTDAPPEIVGCLHEDAVTSVGERVVLYLAVVDEDASPQILWEVEAGTLTNPSGSTTAWIAPESIAGESEAFTIYGEATDSLKQSSWCFQEITVLASPLEESTVELEIGRANGCGGEGAAALLMLPLLGLQRRYRA